MCDYLPAGCSDSDFNDNEERLIESFINDMDADIKEYKLSGNMIGVITNAVDMCFNGEYFDVDEVIDHDRNELSNIVFDAANLKAYGHDQYKVKMYIRHILNLDYSTEFQKYIEELQTI